MSKQTDKPRKSRSKAKSAINYADEMLRVHGVDVPALRALEARYSEEARPRLAEAAVREPADVEHRIASHGARLSRLRGTVTLGDRAAQSERQGGAGMFWSGPPGWQWVGELEAEILPSDTDFEIGRYQFPSCGFDQYQACTPPLEYQELDPPMTNPMWANTSTLNVEQMRDEPGLTPRFVAAVPGAGLFTMGKLDLHRDFALIPIGPGRWCFRPDIALLGRATWDILDTGYSSNVYLKVWCRVAVREYDDDGNAHHTIDSKEMMVLEGSATGTHSQDVDWSTLDPGGLTVQAYLTGDGRPVNVHTWITVTFYASGDATADLDFASVVGYGFRHNGLKWGHYRGYSLADYRAPQY